MGDSAIEPKTRKSQVNKGLRKSYDSNFKIMVAIEAETTNNCAAARKFCVTENSVRLWRQQKNKLLNAHSTRKAFRGPKKGRYEEVDAQVVEYVDTMRDRGLPVTRESIQTKGREIAKVMNIPEGEFKASLGWCKRMMSRNGLALRRRTALARVAEKCEEEEILFQGHTIGVNIRLGDPLNFVVDNDREEIEDSVSD